MACRTSSHLHARRSACIVLDNVLACLSHLGAPLRTFLRPHVRSLKGILSVRVPDSDRKDEIGRLAIASMK